jgi:hypothetical protein
MTGSYTDETNDVDIQIITASVFLSYSQSQISGTEDQHLLAGGGHFPDPVQTYPAENDEHRNKRETKHQDPAAQEKVRKGNISQAQDQTAGSQSLGDADQLPDASPKISGAIKIVIVEANLERDYYREALQQKAGGGDIILKFRRVAPESDPGRAQNGYVNQYGLQKNKKQSFDGNILVKYPKHLGPFHQRINRAWGLQIRDTRTAL